MCCAWRCERSREPVERAWRRHFSAEYQPHDRPHPASYTPRCTRLCGLPGVEQGEATAAARVRHGVGDLRVHEVETAEADLGRLHVRQPSHVVEHALLGWLSFGTGGCCVFPLAQATPNLAARRRRAREPMPPRTAPTPARVRRGGPAPRSRTGRKVGWGIVCPSTQYDIRIDTRQSSLCGWSWGITLTI